MNERLNININNISTTQMRVYRILRTSMGLQRYEAKIAMLGYLLGEESTKLSLYNYIAITDKILELTKTQDGQELHQIRHEWEHLREILKTPVQHQASVKPKA